MLQGGADILRLRAAVTAADQVGTVEARGWDVTTKKKLTATAPAQTNPGISIGTTPGEAAARVQAGQAGRRPDAVRPAVGGRSSPPTPSPTT